MITESRNELIGIAARLNRISEVMSAETNNQYLLKRGLKHAINLNAIAEKNDERYDNNSVQYNLVIHCNRKSRVQGFTFSMASMESFPFTTLANATHLPFSWGIGFKAKQNCDPFVCMPIDAILLKKFDKFSKLMDMMWYGDVDC